MTPLRRPTDPSAGTARRRPRRGLAAAGIAALLLASGCGEDAVTDGVAPEGDGEPPQDPQPQDNVQDAPNAEDPDLSGDEEPGLGDDGSFEETGEDEG